MQKKFMKRAWLVVWEVSTRVGETRTKNQIGFNDFFWFCFKAPLKMARCATNRCSHEGSNG
jgi:hypothetical protein